MKWKSLFAAALAAAVAVPAAFAQQTTGGGIPSGRVISVNFAGDESGNLSGPISNDEGTFGLVPVPGSAWVDCHGATTSSETGISGTQEITSAYGSEESISATLTYSAKNMYGLATNSGILKTWLGDGNGAQIEVTNIPFDNYAVIVYFATNNGDSFKPVTVNNTKYIGTTAGSEEAGDTESWGSPQPSDIALGTNALRVNGLSGNLSIVGASSDGSGGARCCIAGFQIVEVLPSISMNFAGDASGDHSVPIPETSDSYGLFPVPGSEWKNGFTGSGTIQVSSAYGSSETFSSTLSYKSKNIWYNMDNDTLLQTYLDDGTDTNNNINGASISMDNVPFTEYAVIVYCAGGNSAFLPVTVNGTSYTWDTETGATVEGNSNFGSSSVTTPTLGQNALCVTGLTDAALTIQGQSGGENTARGGIAAIQIICTGEIKTSSEPVAETSVISLNFGSNYGSVRQTATEYGLIPVPGYTWTNISGARGSQTVTVASGKPLTKEPTVAYDSNLTYYYNQATDPFLKGYLDDGQRSEGVGASVTVRDLPFWAYDVVVYAGLGDNGAVARPVRVNGTLYTWDSDRGATIATDDETAAYGGIQEAAQYGRNALRVKGLSDYEYKLTIQGLPRSDSQRGGIAAIQIVERKVIQNDNIGDLDDLSSDTPVHILLTAQISGNLTLPPDAILDLSTYWLYGATPPITGTLTVNEGTQIRLPKGASWTIAGAISGTLAKNAVIVDGSLATGVEVNAADGTISADATYVWTGSGKNDLWSNQYNWSSHTVPDAEADVTIPLAANGAVTIELPSDAVAKSVTITGPESGAATLALTSAEGGATGSLTVSGQMLTTGNVAVTQNADITVNGAATAAEGNVPAGYYAKGSFDVNGATYTLSAGTLTVANQTDCAFLVGNGATFTVGGGEEAATLSFPRTGVLHPIPSVDSRIIVAANGTLSSQSALDTPSDRYKWELAGGTLALATEDATHIRVYGGIEVSGNSTLSFVAQTANIIAMGENPSALTGEGNLTLSGAGTFSFGTSTAVTSGAPLTGYTGELSVLSGLTLVLGEARPALTVAESATVNITPTAEEQATGVVSFGTSMKTLPSATFTVEGVDAVTPAVDNGKLTLSWEASTATLSTTGDWSAANWTVGETTGQAAPESGVVVLDGTAEGGIIVTLDKAIPAAITTINVKGDVTLVATEQQATLPTCINVVEAGATLGVGANFDKADDSAWPETWDIPANTTLRVTGADFSFGGITVDNNGYIQVYADLEVTATGTEGTPAVIEPSANLWCRGEVTVSGSDVTLKKLYWLDDDTDGLTVTGNNVTIDGLRQVDGSDGLTLSGNNVTITGDVKGLVFAAGATITSSGTGNVLDGLTDLPTELHVTGGDLTIDSCATLGGALLTNGATLKLASDWASGQELKVSAGDNSATTLDLSAINPANRPTLNRYSDTHKTLPKTIIVAPSVEETEAGVIDITLLQDLVPAADTVVQVVAEPAWNPAWEVVTEGGKKLRITNVVLKPVLPEGSTLSEAATAALNAAAEQAGITGEYAVAITTGDATVQVTTAEAATQLQEVLECFTGLTLKASTEGGNTVTVVYDFGVVGIKRNTTGDGWVVTAKVQSEGAAQAGFAEGNAYTLKVKVPGETGSERIVNVTTVDEANIGSGTVELTVPDAALEGVGEPFTLGVSVSRTAQQL